MQEMKFKIISMLIFLSGFLFYSCHAGMINDFEDGDDVNNVGTGNLRVYEAYNDWQTLSVVPGGANGSSYAARIVKDGSENPCGENDRCSTPINGLYYGRHYTYLFSDANAQGIPYEATADSDRLSMYIKAPVGHNQTVSQTPANLHLGTYTLIPGGTGNGTHFYHWFNIQGSDYWTKIIANSHPEHQVAVCLDLVNNPVEWDYWPRMTRLYLQGILCSSTANETWMIDEITGYTPSESEDDDHITSISCTYLGNGRFQLGWFGSSSYDDISDTFDVYYSSNPLLNHNYASGTLGVDNLSDVIYGYDISNYFSTTIDTGIESGDIYFAIKCNAADAPAYVSKIDYYISDTNMDTIAPASPSGLAVN